MDLPIYLGAFVAGILMFLAPCTLPIVPGYLVFIAAVPSEALTKEGGAKRSARRKILLNALAFVVGFSVVFIVLGSFAASLGALLGPWRGLLGRVAGLLIIVFGLTMLGVWQIPGLSSERHIRLPKWLSLGHPKASFLVGALFALGWSPCIGPILGTILFLASASATAAQGATLLAIFSLGLALPFMACAWALGTAERFAARMGRTTQILSYIGGVVLILLGVLMLTNNMGLLVQWGFGAFDGAGYSALLRYL